MTITTVKAKLRKSKQDQRVAERSCKTSGRESIADVRQEQYMSFRLRHKFSLMVVGSSLSGKKLLRQRVIGKILHRI